jgi:hypothetical protein
MLAELEGILIFPFVIPLTNVLDVVSQIKKTDSTSQPLIILVRLEGLISSIPVVTEVSNQRHRAVALLVFSICDPTYKCI